MSHEPFDPIAAALDLVDADSTAEEIVMAAHEIAVALPPPQALAPIRVRLEQLRAETAAEPDPGKRARLARAAIDLENLLRQLEHGHAPT